MKNGLIILSILFFPLVYGCDHAEGLMVQPIDERFNQQYLTGKGLDTNFYSRKDVMQYYQVANYTELTDNLLLAKLDSVGVPSFLPGQIQTLTILFYKHKAFVDYRDGLYESARENESGRLTGYNQDLLASIIVERLKKNTHKMAVRRLLYDNNKLKLKETDTLTR